MTYKHEHYPKVLYHETKGSKTVASEAEHEALGEDWVESPAEFEEAAPAEGETKPTKAKKAKSAAPAEGE